MIRRPPRSTLSSSSAASDVYKRQDQVRLTEYDHRVRNAKLKNQARVGWTKSLYSTGEGEKGLVGEEEAPPCWRQLLAQSLQEHPEQELSTQDLRALYSLDPWAGITNLAEMQDEAVVEWTHLLTQEAKASLPADAVERLSKLMPKPKTHDNLTRCLTELLACGEVSSVPPCVLEVGTERALYQGLREWAELLPADANDHVALDLLAQVQRRLQASMTNAQTWLDHDAPRAHCQRKLGLDLLLLEAAEQHIQTQIFQSANDHTPEDRVRLTIQGFASVCMLPEIASSRHQQARANVSTCPQGEDVELDVLIDRLHESHQCFNAALSKVVLGEGTWSQQLQHLDLLQTAWQDFSQAEQRVSRAQENEQAHYHDHGTDQLGPTACAGMAMIRAVDLALGPRYG
eukprot:TRINITY_DN7312_c0_g1_i5.p1 TRINITY_DN7312_c0_g1~~TRINITY_DN7312_c0_g1_i5.p1  ORF type:complete len:401 (+),score=72.82 TRINITY_DN7312_c0_g1_i5:125-1327(+)